jgi:MFS family permease
MLKTDRNVLRLASAQALAGANSTIVYATGAIVGNTLAPSPELSTLPISIFVAGMALSTLPMGGVARKYGRRTAFLIGNICGVLMGLIAAYGVVHKSFFLFCLAMVFGGAYAAIVLTFRFAAAECVKSEERPKALSMVMAGGVLAGVVGPQLANVTMDLWPAHVYAVTFLASAVVAIISAMVLTGVHLKYEAPQLASAGRPIAEIIRQPKFIVAVLCGTVSYVVMNLLMTSAPLAMDICGISRTDTNWGIQWHIIGMYAPSFFTGKLITRFGVRNVILTGFMLLALSAVIGYSGTEISNFFLSLILLGVGWNFGFLGASALVLECHATAERTKVQSLNDFIVFGMMFLGSFASGGLLTTYGWETLCLAGLPALAIAAMSLFLIPKSGTPAT